MHTLLKATMCDGTDHGQPTVCGHGTPNEMAERRFSAVSEPPPTPVFSHLPECEVGERGKERGEGRGGGGSGEERIKKSVVKEDVDRCVKGKRPC